MCFFWAQWNSFIYLLHFAVHIQIIRWIPTFYLTWCQHATGLPWPRCLRSEVWNPWCLGVSTIGRYRFDMGSFISHVIHEALQGFHAFQALEPVFEAWDFIYHPTTRSPDLLPGGFAPQGGENMLCRSGAKLDISTWLFFKIRFG